MKKTLILYFIVLSILEVYGQESLAKMKIDYLSTGRNTGIQFKKDELIVVFKPLKENKTWAVWNKNGESGFLDTIAFKVIHGKPIFKLISIPSQLKSVGCDRHTKVLSKQINVNYCRAIKRVVKKRSNALTKFFNLTNELDAALAEIHAADTWTVINLYTDEELYSWLKTLDSNGLKQFVDYLKDEYVAYPITRYAEYLSLYYPKSWTIIRVFQ